MATALLILGCVVLIAEWIYSALTPGKDDIPDESTH